MLNASLLIAAGLFGLSSSSPVAAGELQATNQTTNDLQSSDQQANNLPTVNLGYSTYRATALNATGAYYNFSNIRYAAPPLGDLRWAAPKPPVDAAGVQDGSVGYICSQSIPTWFGAAIGGLGPLLQSFPADSSSQQQSEDCLFLDVMAPTQVFKSAGSKTPKLVPVMFNIHGGGYFLGDKRTNYDPQGLLRQAQGGMIYVSPNYRLGAFGFLSGLQPSAANTTTPNAGLLDQRMALKWVKKYIHLFGGDPSKVTVIGQSAGGGSVEYHTTAYGGSRPDENSLIAGAISQSPAPLITDQQWRVLGANSFLQAAGATSVDQLRKLPSATLQQANQKSQALTPQSVAFFVPVIDKDFIPDHPSNLYRQGKFNKNIKVMASHQADEGRLFSNSSVQTDAEYDDWVRTNYPSSGQATWSYISQKLYPPTYDGSQGYRTPQERLQVTTQDLIIACNTVAINQAYGNKANSYNFAIPPAIHSQDLLYTYNRFANVPAAGDPAQNLQTSITMQKAFTRFTITGSPNVPGSPQFPPYGANSQILNLAPTGPVVIKEPSDNARCQWVNRNLYSASATTGPRSVEAVAVS
ncbi:uncharacterized protein KY384_004004 [Bacidia gigantensis]|uniref:uncharacterized protein n=1 Tax=Bacidia gigantensis TaxID=2732470 RepID=UPI001D045CFF|nr:uncharacterized protein KY384_004004 [Bacidia gigantensis]KAG8530649.1 hypothetical protein KY384_004004 [Bacidia gigantensis]